MQLPLATGRCGSLGWPPVITALLVSAALASPKAQDPGSAPKAAPAAAPAAFAPYQQPIPGSDVSFAMVPIQGGTFRMGSPAEEAHRGADEGPQVEVQIAPFWMGRCEVTWAEFDLWNTDTERPQSKLPDGMARPTPPYMDMTFNMGRDGYPAICMSHIAARQYCQWLSKKTGHFHRLPTEAEWEYACRAGTTTPYWSGDRATLDKIAWHEANSARALEAGGKPVPAYHKVGELPPNPWGLCDMHGNVAEWVADTYLADAFAEAHGKAPRSNPYFAPPRDARNRPVRFPHVVRGGSWRDAPESLRAAARQSSDPAWNSRDPQIPKSWWYLTEGQHLGFRVVRPLQEPTAAERARFDNP